METVNPFIFYETSQLKNKIGQNLLFLLFNFNCCGCDRTFVFNKFFYNYCYAFMDFDGVFVKIKKKKKSKFVKTLEEGNLLFNLVLSVWFLILAFVFSGVFKLILPYKFVMFTFYFLLSILLVNLFSKIIDIYSEYTKETASEKIHRELLERKAKKKL